MMEDTSQTASQLVVDLYGCPIACIDDVSYIKQTIHKICENIHAGIVEECYHKFEPIGISAVAVITTSHISIHTWPEYGYAAVDIFSCHEEVTEEVCKYIKELLQAEDMVVRRFERALERKGGNGQ